MSARKLTLSIDPDVVAAAKRYAETQGTSVSHLVESFLAAVSSSNAPSNTTPILTRLRGTLKGVSIEDHRAYLVEKHSG